jgi:outer membrane protein TolC
LVAVPRGRLLHLLNFKENPMNFLRVTFFALLLLPVATAARAQTLPATGNELERVLASRPLLNETLGMERAVEIALRESPVLRGASAEVEAATARIAQARAAQRPALSLNGFLSRSSGPSNVVTPIEPSMAMDLPRDNFAALNVMAMFPLYTGGRLQALTRRAAALRDAAQADVETQRAEVALLTRLAYHEALARRALVDVWRERLQADEEQLRVDRARAEEGKIPPFYVQRGEAEVAQTQQEIANAERDVELSLAQLKTVMGVNLLSQLSLSDVLEYAPSAAWLPELSASSGAAPGDVVPATPPLPASPATFETPAVLPSLLRVAQNRRPELQSASRLVRAAQAATDAARGERRPQVELFAMGTAGREDRDGAFSGATFGVVASYPLFDSGLRRARVRETQADRRREEQERERVALQVGQEVTNALLRLQAAERNTQTSQTALAAAREDYRVARIRYEAGKSIPVEVLDALAARTRAEANVVQAKFQYAAARDQLLRAVGVLPVAGQTPPQAAE